jgi:hypothetical protein
MFTRNELTSLGFVPKTKYKMGQPFPEDFSLPKEITNEMFKKIPLYIQIRYSYTPVNNIHFLT